MFALNEKRIITLYIIIMFLMGVMFFKLYSLAVGDYSQILPALTNQYTRKLNAAERRGFVFDRYGNIIAGFEDGYNCVIDPSKIPMAYISTPETFDDAANKIFNIRSNRNISQSEIKEQLTDGKPFVMRITENINNEYMMSFQNYKRNETPSPAALHITGYVNKEGKGTGGIEEVYDDFLKKTSAKIDVVYESNALRQSFGGSPLRITDYGYNKKTGITLTIDIDLQKKTEEIADKYFKKGAIVVALADTGEILASVSRPTYSTDNLAAYIDSENGEFINRAFSSFTPGSVFKTIIAAAALEYDKNYYNKEYECTGIINAGGKSFNCNRKWGHGIMTMREAYAESCNTYFMNLALEIGYDRIYDMAKKLGIGEYTALDGLNVKSGNIPEINNPPPAFIANASIGQGELLITPLEAVRIFCCIANDGVMPELSLVKSFVFENKIADAGNYAAKKVLGGYTVKCLLEMAEACVEHGTGIPAAPEYGIAGGKTSSAESGQYTKIEVFNEETGEKGRQNVQIVHSWFSGYYPSNTDKEYPTYAISVIAEGGVTENIKSASVFKEICDYLSKIIR